VRRQRDLAIADYTQGIELDSKKAYLFSERGAAFEESDRLDRAMDDYNEALRLNPRSADAFHSRGRVYVIRGEFERAVADYTELVRLDNKPVYIVELGFLNFLVGHYSAAATNFSSAAQQKPNLYTALWLYLARERSGDLSAAEQLGIFASVSKNAEWPYPIVTLFLGRGNAEATYWESVRLNPCEANFYVGE
jgi:lipoprotein NlpI